MDPMEVISDGKYSQSMENKEICILVMDDDHACCAIVAKMSQSHTTFEVLHTGIASEVLETIEKRRDIFELVLTNIHMLESSGREIIQCINEEFNIPTILMYPDNMKIVSKGEEHIVKTNVVNSFSMDKLNHLWQLAFEKVKAKKVVVNNLRANSEEIYMSSQERLISSQETDSPSISESLPVHKREKDRNTNEPTQRSKKKKPRMVWTKELHAQFMKALDILGEKAVPKKIVKLMDHPGLTRENVSSHLQKYRDSKKRDKDDTSSSPLGSISRLNSLQRNPFFVEQGYTTSFQRGRTSLFNPRQSRLFPANSQMDTPMYINRQQNFKLYYQTKNIYAFAGLRLANNGRSIEFGQQKVFHSGTTENEYFNVIEPALSVNQDLILNKYPSPVLDSLSQQPSQMTTFASHIQLNTAPDQNPSALFDCISQESSLVENSPNEVQQQGMELISRPTNGNPAVQYSSQFLEYFKNESTDQCPSALLFDPEMDWNDEVWTPQLPQMPQQMNDFVDKGKMENTSLQVNLDNLDFGQLFDNDEQMM